MLCYLILRNYHCHGLNAKCSVQTVVLIQEELTKEERQDSYVTQLLKGASYVSSYSRSHVRRRSAPSIYIGCNPLHYPPPFLLGLVRGPLSCCLSVRTVSASQASEATVSLRASSGSQVGCAYPIHFTRNFFQGLPLPRTVFSSRIFSISYSSSLPISWGSG